MCNLWLDLRDFFFFLSSSSSSSDDTEFLRFFDDFLWRSARGDEDLLFFFFSSTESRLPLFFLTSSPYFLSCFGGSESSLCCGSGEFSTKIAILLHFLNYNSNLFSKCLTRNKYILIHHLVFLKLQVFKVPLKRINTKNCPETFYNLLQTECI